MAPSEFDLECRDVVKTFGSMAAVDRVTLAIPKGSFFSILGPSGCGKTTLLRLMAGFAEPTSGDILIKGKSVLTTPPNRRPVNMVFQHLALFPMMSVAENIGYGLRRRGLGREEIARKVDAILARVGLPESGPKRIHQLSGGQKQRIAIARCMVLEPTVLLLDEPLGALDLKLREHMKVELKLLQQQFGTTFVYITHDQSEALVMSDRVAVMNAGKFEQVGTPQELYYRPNTAFVASFVGESNRLRGRVRSQSARAHLIDTGSGLSIAAASANGAMIGAGANVSVFIRPESIALSLGTNGSDAGKANFWEGTIENLLFNGANSRAIVRLAKGDTLSVALPQSEDLTNYVVGSTVSLTLSAENGLCFRDQGQ